MKKKKLIVLFTLLFSVLLTLSACTKKPSQAKVIMGTWYAQDKNGKNVTIVVTPTEVKIDNQTFFRGDQRVSGHQTNMEPQFKDYSIVKDEETVVYYGYVLKNNQIYVIAFPKKGNTNIGLFIKSDRKANAKLSVNNPSSVTGLKGTMLYAMNKKTPPSYQDYAEKYLKAGNN